MTENFTVGVDIGGTNTVIGFIDNNGNFVDEQSIETLGGQGVDNFIIRLSDNIEEMNSRITENYSISGIGIAAPTANYLNGTIEGSSNLKWGNVNIVDMMKNHFDVPIVIENDANAAALGELAYGKAKGMKNFIVLTLGTGFGSGIVIDGKVFYGQNGLAGEIGHTVIEANGRECSCGKSGCLETYISGRGLKRTVFYLLSRSNDESRLREINYNDLTAKKISELALENDPIALKAFDFTGEIFGRKLADLVASFNPEAIILFGGLADSDELLLKPTRKYFKQNLLSIYEGKVELLKSELQNGKAAVLGVGNLIYNEIRMLNEVPK
jgi:glucokinase